MPYRGKPIAEGGFIPSQIGTGEAQVFQPLDTSFLEKSVLQEREIGLAREKLEAAQQQAQTKAKAKRRKEAKIETDYSKIPFGSRPPIKDLLVDYRQWTIDNIGTPDYENQAAISEQNILALIGTLQDTKTKNTQILENIETGEVLYENEDVANNIEYDPEGTIYQAIRDGDFAKFSEEYMKLNASIKPIEVFDTLGWGSGVASKVKGGYISSGLGVWNEELQKMVVTDSYNEKKHDEDIKAVVKEDFNNPNLTVKKYWTDRYKDDALEKAQEYAIRLKTPVLTKTSFVGTAKATGKTGWQGKYGTTEKGYNLTPTEKGFVNKRGDRFSVTDWELSQPGKQTDDHIVDLNIAGEQVKADIYAFRQTGDDWSVLYTYKDPDEEEYVQDEISLEKVKGKIKGKLLLTEYILNDWGNKYSSGGTAPRTTGGADKDPLGINK